MEKNIWKIIKIIDDFEVIINAGKEDFIKVNDIFEIVSPGETIIDPDTKEDLGTLDFIKAKIIVKELYDKFSVCRNIETNLPSQYLSNNLSQSFTKPLKVDAEEITGRSLSYDAYIKLGDSVRKSSK